MARSARASQAGYCYHVLSPLARPEHWLAHVNEPHTEAELERLRDNVRRGRPFGDTAWTATTARLLGLEPSIHPHGRPRKRAADQASLFKQEKA